MVVGIGWSVHVISGPLEEISRVYRIGSIVGKLISLEMVAAG